MYLARLESDYGWREAAASEQKAIAYEIEKRIENQYVANLHSSHFHDLSTREVCLTSFI